MARKGPFKDLKWGKLNKGKSKKIQRSLSNRYRTSLMSQLKQNVAESATPKNKPSGPFKAIVLRVDNNCPGPGAHPGHDGAPNASAGTSFLNAWYKEILAVDPPELIKMKVRIPTLHASIPEPEKYGCDCSPGMHQYWINMHPTFYASSQDIEMPECGDMVVVSVDSNSDAGQGGGGVVISTVVTRENDGGIQKGGACPPSEIAAGAEANAASTAEGAEGDAVGGDDVSNTSTSPINAGDMSWDELADKINDSEYNPPFVPARNEDGTPSYMFTPYDRKGVFITAEALGSRTMGSPLAAIKKALWADIGYVCIEALWQGPPKGGTSAKPLTRKTNINLLREYVRAFRIAGLNVYLWGHPWPGKAEQFSDYITSTAVDLGASGVVMFPGWGFLSRGNKGKYSPQAKYLTRRLMREAKRLDLQLGFTNNWIPDEQYTVGNSGISVKYKDSFPYACFTDVDWTICQVLSANGGSNISINTYGHTEYPITVAPSTVEAAGDYGRLGDRPEPMMGGGSEPYYAKFEIEVGSSDGENALGEKDFIGALEDYVSFGFKNIIPAFGALGHNYHDYGVDGRKPPKRMQQELEFLAPPGEPAIVGGFSEQDGDGNQAGGFGLGDGDASVYWDEGYFGKKYIRNPDDFLEVTDDSHTAEIRQAVMWWDWLSLEETSQCWKSSKWRIVKNFDRYSPLAVDRSAEGAAQADQSFSAYSQEVQNAIGAIEAYNRIADRDPHLTKSSAQQYLKKVKAAPSLYSFGGISSMKDINDLGQAASTVARSAATEMGYDAIGTGTTDPLGEPSSVEPSTTDIADLGAILGSDPTEQPASTEGGSSMTAGLQAYPAFSYINFDDPINPNMGGRSWSSSGYRGGWAPTHYYEPNDAQACPGKRGNSGARSGTIKYVVIHTTAGYRNSAGGEEFQSPCKTGSTQYGINKGGWVFQFAKESDVCWQAGVGADYGPPNSQTGPRARGEASSAFDKLRFRENSQGVGIEIQGVPKEEANAKGTWYSDQVYENLAYLVANICARNGIPVNRDHIYGHDEITISRSDPGTMLQAYHGDGSATPFNQGGGIDYPFDGDPGGGDGYPGTGWQINSYSPGTDGQPTFDWTRFMDLVKGFFDGAGMPTPPAQAWEGGSAGGGGGGSGAAAAGAPITCGPAGASGGSGGGGGAGGPASDVYQIGQVPDVTPETAVAAGAFTADPNYREQYWGPIPGRERLVAADISSLPDGPNITVDYLNSPYNGSAGPTKVILGRPVAYDVAPFFYAMVMAAKADGINFVLNSAWRTSPGYGGGGSGAGAWVGSTGQQTLYDKNCSGGSCSPPTARPGTSRHQKAVAFDINDTTRVGSNIFEWLSKNAEAFGFYRTVRSERWHWVFDPTANKYTSVSADHSSWPNG
jgi:hypothetical protein